MTQMVNANPLYFERPETHPRFCDACGSVSLTRGMLHAGDRVEMFACDECGDFWFERAGTRLTAAAMRELGLLSR
jgi:hypothetical protein